MGGRRVRSLRSVLGSAPPAARNQLRRALQAGDPTEIATGAAQLLASSKAPASAIYYAGKLAGEVRELLKSPQIDLGRGEEVIRRAWADISKSAKLPPDPVLDQLVVGAMLAALPRGKKRGGRH